jgi:Mor family transcriptional regulator
LQGRKCPEICPTHLLCSSTRVHRVSNLRWITPSENSTKSIEKYPKNRNKLRDVNRKNGYYKYLMSEAWKKRFTISQLFGKGIKVAELADIFGCSCGTVYNILRKQKLKRNKNLKNL